MKPKALSKKLKTAVLMGVASVSLWGLPAAAPALAPTAEASGIVDILNGIAGIASTYNEYLDKYLALGNSPKEQDNLLKRDMTDNGQDLDEEDNEVVTRVMNQLLEKGDYAIPANGLPFRWRVNNSEDFNAGCTAMDYVTVNRGLVVALQHNPDEIAGVLGHELIHGLHQHLQYEIAKVAATNYGVALLQQQTSDLNATLLGILANYNQAKNYAAPNENDADRCGFHLMASAGFNPGGFAAMVTRMPDSPGESILEPDDHPETSTRLRRALEWMTQYSCGHVTATADEKSGTTTVAIDGTPFYTTTVMTPEAMAAAGETYSAKERAYFVAGGLAKGFHDNKFSTMWGFRTLRDGTVDFLDGSDAYGPLKDAVRDAGKGKDLEALVEAAYNKERQANARAEMILWEKEVKDKIERTRAKATEASEENIDSYETKSDVYNQMGLTHLAKHEANRLLACNPDDPDKAFAHGELGWALYKEKNYDGAIAEHQKAVAINPSSGWNYMRLSYAEYAADNYDAALDASKKAEQASPGKFYGTHVVTGLVHAKRGDRAAAKREFRHALSISEEAKGDIPEEFLTEMSDEEKAVAEKYNN